jgi:hypothetical protein
MRGGQRPASANTRKRASVSLNIELRGLLEMENVAGLGEYREAGRRDGLLRLGWMQASSRSPVMIAAKVFVDV